MPKSRNSAALLAAGLLVLAVELLRAPGDSLAAIALFAGVWLVKERILRKPQHHLSYHRVRREILTTSVVAALLVAVAALAITALELTGEAQPLGQLGAPGDDQLPWAAGLLVNGVCTLIAVAWTLVGGRGLQRRSRRHQERTV